MDKIEQFQKDVEDLNKLLKGKKPFMFEAHDIHKKMVTICTAYYGYVPSTIMPGWAREEKTKKEKAEKVVDELWAELGDIDVNEDDKIEQAWKHFPVGTSKFDIWHWIEETYDVSIAEDLINSITS